MYTILNWNHCCTKYALISSDKLKQTIKQVVIVKFSGEITRNLVYQTHIISEVDKYRSYFLLQLVSVANDTLGLITVRSQKHGRHQIRYNCRA